MGRGVSGSHEGLLSWANPWYAADMDANALAKLTPAERSALTMLVGQIRERFGPLDVTLYGSAARGELEVDSDIDLFIVLPSVNGQIEQSISDLCYDAMLCCGRLFGAMVFDRQEVVNTPLRSDPFVLSVKREGLAL